MEIIRNLREENDLKQSDVAKIIGIERSTYTSYEIGRDTIPLKHLNSLCNYFNISLDYAMGLTKTKRYKKELDDINRDILTIRLKSLRKENKITQSALSNILNISRSTWTGYESGKFLINTIILYEIARRYNYSMDYLVGKTEYPIKLNNNK